MHGGEEICLRVFGGERRMTEATWRTWTLVARW